MPYGWNGPTPVNVVDANAYELGTEQRANQDVTLTGIRVWSDGQNVGGRQARIWNPSSGQVVQTIDIPAQLSPGWSVHPLTTPIPRTSGQRWIVGFHTGGNYGTVPNGTTTDVVSADGNVTTLASLNATNGNGVFRTVPGQFPNQNFGATFYGVDVEYSPGLGDASAPVISAVEVETEELAASVTVAATDAEGDALSYTIEWGDGTSSSSGNPTQVHQYAASGTYALLVRVSDPGGLADYTAAVVTVAAFPDPISDPVVMPLARELLACYDQELQKLEDPPTYVQLRAGNVVSHLLSTFQDECCEGLAWVRPASFFPSSAAFPGQDAAPMKGGTRAWAVTLELGFVRCAPVGDENTIPTAADWDATVQAVMDGAAAMRRALCCFEGGRQVLPGIWQPIEVQGGCVGGLMTLTVRGPACDCSAAGPAS